MILVAFVALVAFSAFEGTFSLLVRDRFGLTLSSTGAVFTVIGIALVLVQTGLVHPAAARLGEIGTVRMGLAANAAGLLLLAADGGWATLVPALAAARRRPGPRHPHAVVGRRRAGDARRRGQALGLQQSAERPRPASSGPAVAGVLFGHVGVAVPYLVARGPRRAGGLPRARRPPARVGSPRIDALAWLPPGNMRVDRSAHHTRFRCLTSPSS